MPIIGYNLSQSFVGCTRLAVPCLTRTGWAVKTASTPLLDLFKRLAALTAHTYLAYYSKYKVTRATAAEKQAAAAAGGRVLLWPSALRMDAVAVTSGEQYYLRALVTCVPVTSLCCCQTRTRSPRARCRPVRPLFCSTP